MKPRLALIALILFTLACGSSAPTAAPTAVPPTKSPPTATPEFAELTLTFVNNSAVPMEYFWVNDSAQEESYGTVDAGTSADITTYTGHIWRIRNQAGALVQEYTVTDDPAQTLTIDADVAVPVVEVGQVMNYGSLEITVLAVDGHTLIVPGGTVYYYAKNGGAFLDLGVLVKNTDPANPVKIVWNQIYIVEENGDAWAPGFADVKNSNNKIDPFGIGINTSMTEELSKSEIEFGADNTYMRLIYVVKNINQTIIFGVEGSPQTKIDFKKK